MIPIPRFSLITAVEVGQGTIIHDHVNLYKCRIGRNCKIDAFVYIEEGVEIGDYCKIRPFTFIPTGVLIEDDVFISGVKLLSNYVVRKGSILFNCGTIVASEKTNFGNGSELPIAIETGGREVKAFAEITVDIAAKIATSRSDTALIRQYGNLVDQYVKKITSPKGIIEEGAVIKNT